MAIRGSLVTMLCAAGLAFAQFDMTASQSGGKLTLTFTPNRQAAAIFITGRPYSATLTSERTTPDGTRMIQPDRRVYRDLQGRTRTEEKRPTIYSDPFLAVEIVDPVAGYAYLLDSENRVVHRLAIEVASKPADRAHIPCSAWPPANTGTMKDGGTMTTEPLGTQMIEGVLFCGRRTTLMRPAGSIHNNRPVESVDEMWMAWDDGLPFTIITSITPGGSAPPPRA